MLLTPLFAYDAFFAKDFKDSVACTKYLTEEMTSIKESCAQECSVTCSNAYDQAMASISRLPRDCKKLTDIDVGKLDAVKSERAQAIVSSILYSESLNHASCKPKVQLKATKSNVTNELNAIVTSKLINENGIWSRVLLTSLDKHEAQLGRAIKKMEHRFGKNGSKARFLTVNAKHNRNKLTDLDDTILFPQDIYASFYMDNSLESLNRVTDTLDNFALASSLPSKSSKDDIPQKDSSAGPDGLADEDSAPLEKGIRKNQDALESSPKSIRKEPESTVAHKSAIEKGPHAMSDINMDTTYIEK